MATMGNALKQAFQTKKWVEMHDAKLAELGGPGTLPPKSFANDVKEEFYGSDPVPKDKVAWIEIEVKRRWAIKCAEGFQMQNGRGDLRRLFGIRIRIETAILLNG